MPGETSTAMDKDKPYHLNLPWVEKYRPQHLDELISHDEIISTIKKFISVDKLPHLLFYGPPGTGKTSTILACAKQLYAPNEFSSMVLELNASDDRGIGIVRGQVLNFASTRTIFKSKYKLVILDEADAMTNDAQNALRRVIEKYTENVRFCIICNYLSKIIPALQSRCTRFRFGPLKPKQIRPRLAEVVKKENLAVNEEGTKALLKLGEGDMRKILNILQSTALAFSDPGGSGVGNTVTLTANHFYLCTGAPLPADIDTMVTWMLTLDLTSAFTKIHDMKTRKGIALADILTEVHKSMEKIDFPPTVRIFLLKEMAEIEYRLSIGTSEKLQLGALVGLFYEARNKVEAHATE
ncbi:replication factor C subunit 5 [Folsomia candida]|uniref:Replication factor C subunit 5 n=1 Tax=Folsomia candida TaxID=158441 RepID=A0A226D6C0_FOLCA|nr:replication factor C subunit 5 [Folsomia candida]OXA40414.1 Replication factor C subunit 5 [Folsomia candida]